MKTYTKNGFEYFYDTNCRQWVLYPIDNLGNRIEWDANNKPELNNYLNK